MCKRGEGITPWTEQEIEEFKIVYPLQGKKYCMDKFNKSDWMVRDTASRLGLKRDKNGPFFKEWQKRAAQSKVGKKRPEQSKVMKATHAEGKFLATFTEERRERMAKQTKERLEKNGHPKGMKGKHHTPEAKELMSKGQKKLWQQKGDEEREAYSTRLAKRVREQGLSMRTKVSWKADWREIGGKNKFFRSRWEANYARYLEMLKQDGTILDWLHEPDVFWFEAIKRGTRSYLPDFKVFYPDGSIEYHETKGWMDARSATQQKRMKKYHPSVIVKLIQSKEYKELERKYSTSIEGWEMPAKNKKKP